MRPLGNVVWFYVFVALVLACCIGTLWLVRGSGLVELFHVSAALVFMAGALVIYHGLEWFDRPALAPVDRPRE